jgi:hypothetical protein
VRYFVVTFRNAPEGPGLELDDGQTRRPVSAAEAQGELLAAALRGAPEARYLRAAMRRPGRPVATHPIKWAQKFRELKATLNDAGYESPVEGENARLSDFELRVLVAIWDFEEGHLAHWDFDPRVERRKAADRVDKAIKRLI